MTPLERLRDWIDDPKDSVPWIRRTLYALLAIQALTFLARGADRPTDPYFKARVAVTVAPPVQAPATTTPAVLPGG